MSDNSNKIFDVAIVGGGLAGLTSALTLARQIDHGSINNRAKIALVYPPSPHIDGRTTALLGYSVTHLEKLGLWQDCLEYAAPLANMRILDGTNRLWRAPPVNFKAIELGLDAFGYNIANSDLSRVLHRHIAMEESISIISDSVGGVDFGDDMVQLRTETSGTISAKLIIAADGKNSRMRQAADIDVKKWQYPQSAIAVNFTHSGSHHHTSTEFHTEEGPFTVVPMPSIDGKYQSGLVWVLQPEKANRLVNLEPAQLELMIENKMQSMLGKVHLVTTPQQFPMSSMIAKSFATRRVALVGDAAHLFPPIGAQGFNLGLRDLIEICNLASVAISRSEDPGDQKLLARFDRSRRMDIATRTGAVDMLNRSLLTDFLPVQAFRGLSLFALARFPALRKFAMRQGLATGHKHTSNAA